MEELFFLPPTPVAMPRSYWETPPKLNSQVMLIQPSVHDYGWLEKVGMAGEDKADMELVNDLYQDTATVLPHKIYDSLTPTFRENQEAFLGDESQQWDSDAALGTAKLLHSSDWPLPKPWIKTRSQEVGRVLPPCPQDPATHKLVDCRNRELWLGFRSDFSRRREEGCGTQIRIPLEESFKPPRMCQG